MKDFKEYVKQRFCCSDFDSFVVKDNAEIKTVNHVLEIGKQLVLC